MGLKRDPLANPEPLIERVYAYVAYRMGPGPDAEDVTSDVFERAVRYRDRYDMRKGEPLPWLIGIARRCVDGTLASRRLPLADDDVEAAAPQDLEEESVMRLTLRSALAALEDRDQELLALRYGADLTARQIAAIVGARTNAVEVALHRALGRLRAQFEHETQEARQQPVARREARLSNL